MPKVSFHKMKKQPESWPENGLEFLGACPICASKVRTLLHRDVSDRVYFCAPGRWNVYRCEDCGSGYIDPRPTPATIGLAYSTYYTHAAAEGLNQQPLSMLRRHRIAQRNAYLNSTYGYQLSPAAKHPPKHINTLRRQRWDKQVCYLKFPGPGARLLDLGCGNGRFMMQMQAAGWEVYGIDPDQKSVDLARSAGLNAQCGSLDTLDGLPHAHFHAITLHHVLEHLHNPVDTLKRCKDALKSSGQIVIATPNFESCAHRIFGADWFPLQPPTHLILFTFESLRRTLEFSGFQPENLRQPCSASNEFLRKSLALKLDSVLKRGGLGFFDFIRSFPFNYFFRRNTAQSDEIVLLSYKEKADFFSSDKKHINSIYGDQFLYKKLSFNNLNNNFFLSNNPHKSIEEFCIFHKSINNGDEYLQLLAERVRKSICERSAFPIVRFADGEYAFYNFSLKCNGLYQQAESKKTIAQAIPTHVQALHTLAKYGVLAPLLFPTFSRNNLQDGDTNQNSGVDFMRFLKSNEISLTQDNYFPFYSIYAFLTSSFFSEIIQDRSICIVNPDFNFKTCEEWFSKSGSNPQITNVKIPRNFLATQWPSFRQSIIAKVGVRPDIFLVGAGVAALPVCVDLAMRFSATAIDAGHVVNMMNDMEHKSSGPRLFTYPR